MLDYTFEEGWPILENGIRKLIQIIEDETPGLHISGEESMKLYTTTYNMCVGSKHQNSRLYQKYKDTLDAYLTSTALPSLRRAHGQFLVKEVGKRWSNHKLIVRWLCRFLAYLDRYFVPICLSQDTKNQYRPSYPGDELDDKIEASARAGVDFEVDYLKPLGLRCFREALYEEIMCKRVAGTMIDWINRERNGEKIDRSLVKKELELLVEMGEITGGDGNLEYYVNGFENAMIQDTAEYYSREAAKWIANESFPDYMMKVEECLRRETDRVAHYLHPTTVPILIEVVKKKLLSDYEYHLLHKEESGCLDLIKNDKVDDLARMYRLFSQVKTEGLTIAAQIFKKYVTDEGLALVKETEDAVINQNGSEAAGDPAKTGLHQHNFVWKVIERYELYVSYLSPDGGCFNNDVMFHEAFNESFKIFCNKSIAGSSPAELLASFCDRIMKKGGVDKLTHDAVEKALESALRVFSYIADKDLFGEFYRKKLARRLLFDMSASDEHERSVIWKLKQKCGGHFTSKMEGMLTDIAMAKERLKNFEQYLQITPEKKPGVDLNMTVLTTGFWPSYKSNDVNLPSEMANCVEVFKEYYQSSFSNKKLTWIYSLGTCNIVGHFEKKPVELVVTTYQACLLMLFNSGDRLSCSEIVAQLNLAEDDVMRLLHSLACARYKILNKVPNTSKISMTDVFEFNTKFTDKMRRIKIPLPPVDEKKKVIDDVNNDRRCAIDATIVRIMKSRKVLNYQQLVAQCVEQLSSMFKPDIKVIKRRIEDLIARDYLSRDEYDPNTFNYVA